MEIYKTINIFFLDPYRYMDLKSKLKNWMDSRWDYEIKCDVFEPLNVEELKSLAKIHGIDDSLSRLQICSKLSEILEKKKQEYVETLGKDRIICLNDSDPISGVDVKDIDPRSLIATKQNGQVYCFEVEGLYANVFINKNDKNPYTNVKFDDETMETIEKEYLKFKSLKGKKFDPDVYATESNLKALTTQLANYLPYVSGIEKFMKASRRLFNKLLHELNEGGIDLNVEPLDEIIDVDPEKDTRLIQDKTEAVQKLIRIIAADSSIAYPITDIWYDLFQESPKRTFFDAMYYNVFGDFGDY